MRDSWTTVIKYLWVTVGLFMLPLGLGTCLVDPGYYASLNLLPIMLVLSFPVGPLVLLVGAVVIDPPAFTPSLDYSLQWFVAFAAGYLQWFWSFQNLFGKCEITTLGLTQVLPLTLADNPPTQPSGRSTKRLRMRPHNRMAYFDHRGRTPLERAIDDRLRRKGSLQMLSKKGRDLPGINSLPGHLR